jgi:hypothetical protein
MKKLNLSENLTKNLTQIILGCTTTFETEYGLTESINLLTGIKQGDSSKFYPFPLILSTLTTYSKKSCLCLKYRCGATKLECTFDYKMITRQLCADNHLAIISASDIPTDDRISTKNTSIDSP